MKIGLAGNYGHLNLGDEALLLGAIKCACDGAGLQSSDITVLTDNESDTKQRLRGIGCQVRTLRRPYGGRAYLLPAVVIDIYRSLDGLDWLVLGGGGLLNDSNRTAIPMYALLCAIARVRGMRVAWWSVGIGPLQRGWRYKLASKMLSSSDFYTVRDLASARIAQEMVGDEVRIAPDLAHALYTTKADGLDTTSNTIAISVVPYGKRGHWFAADDAGYANYVDKNVRVIRELLIAHPNTAVKLFPISLKQDAAAIQDIVARGDFGDEDRVSIVRPESVGSLLRVLSTASLVIATRLHSVVLSTLAGIATVTIAYQPKVRSYAEELCLGHTSFDIEAFSVKQIVDASNELLQRAASHSEQLCLMNETRRDALMLAIKEWRTI